MNDDMPLMWRLILQIAPTAAVLAMSLFPHRTRTATQIHPMR